MTSAVEAPSTFFAPRQAHDIKGLRPLFGALADRFDALIVDKG